MKKLAMITVIFLIAVMGFSVETTLDFGVSVDTAKYYKKYLDFSHEKTEDLLGSTLHYLYYKNVKLYGITVIYRLEFFNDQLIAKAYMFNQNKKTGEDILLVHSYIENALTEKYGLPDDETENKDLIEKKWYFGNERIIFILRQNGKVLTHELRHEYLPLTSKKAELVMEKWIQENSNNKGGGKE